MDFTWVDYQKEYEEETETWTDNDTVKYAINYTVKKEHVYYMKIRDDYDGHDYKLNSTYFCKVVFDGKKIIAVLFLLKTIHSLITPLR